VTYPRDIDLEAAIQSFTKPAAGPRPHHQTSGALYVHPGRIVVGKTPQTIKCVLGSCVAVSLWDRGSGHGGMNHYQLPHVVTGGRSEARFGNIAMERLLHDVLARGAAADKLVAGIWGGACVLEAFRTSARHLGHQNVTVALRFLREHGIRISQRDVGGNRGRKVTFNLQDGTIRVDHV
jgi:chemotaxis protein CheD